MLQPQGEEPTNLSGNPPARRNGETARPLRKRRKNGELYARRAETERQLTELLGISDGELAARAALLSRNASGYVPSECLLHLLRVTDHDQRPWLFQRLYEALIARVLRSVRTPSESRGHVADFVERVRNELRDNFNELLIEDYNAYNEKLDIYECAFDGTMKKRRLDAEKKFRAKARRHEPLVYEDNEVATHVEEAAGSFDPIEEERLGDPAYRSAFRAAIDSLPEQERKIVVLIKGEVPIELKDSEKPSIVKIIGCPEKTVRNRRDRAYAKIRAHLDEAGVL